MADEWHSATSDMAVQQFDVAASKLGIDPNVAARLRRPDRAMIVSVPTRMDDGRVQVFTGYRVQHNDVLGSVQRRHPLSPGGEPRRSLGAGDVDDLEMLAGRLAARRSEGRHRLRSGAAFAQRAAVDDPAFYRGNH